MSIVVDKITDDCMFKMAYTYQEKMVEFTISLGTDTIETLIKEFEDSFDILFNRIITEDDRNIFSRCLRKYFPKRIGRFLTYTSHRKVR
jgi:hypothetical protein